MVHRLMGAVFVIWLLYSLHIILDFHRTRGRCRAARAYLILIFENFPRVLLL